MNNVRRYVNSCSSCIRDLNRLLRGNLSQPETKRCLSLIGQAETLRTRFGTFLTRGASMQRPQIRGRRLLERRVQWVDLEQAFRNRISTSVVSNIEHIDVDNFLDDACTLFAAKVTS